ncbi:sterol desaturase family protein [soil metagenome]
MELYRDSLFILISMPVYLLLILLEIVCSQREGRHDYTLGGTFTNFSLAGINVILDLLTRGLWFVALTAVYQQRLLQWDNPWLYWLSLLLLQDFLFYFLHRVDHGCRLFWAVHVTHHSSREFNLTVGIRPSVLQPLYRFAWFLPLALLGSRPEDILLMYSLTQLYGVLVHTRHVRSLGVLEWILVTPSHHRVHHGCNPQYLDKNFGMMFIVWDRLFGTFRKEREAVRFGLNGQDVTTRNPLRAISSEWIAIARDLRRPLPLREKLSFVFGPPGWQPAAVLNTSQPEGVS